MEQIYILDARQMDRSHLHSYLREQLPLPEYYGGNLDALFDCLSDLSEVQLIVTHTGMADASFSPVQRVLLDAAAENPSLTVQFWDNEMILSEN
jgi:ribonuclease inhibitor